MPITAIIHIKRSVSPRGGNTTDNNTLVLLSRYVVTDILKSGTDTKVFLVRHPDLEQKLIIKQLSASPLSEERFHREVQTLKSIKHPHIPLLYDIHKDNEYYYIIEEYIEGTSLKSVLDKGCLSPDAAIRYTLELCDILNCLHGHAENSVLYLDCRPDNIIISPDGSVNLIDFGNSIFMKDSGLRHTCYGSIGFAAPELYIPRTALTFATDVYGIGALLYYMLTGALSSDGLDIHRSQIPTGLFNIIKKCLRHKKEQRYSSVNELKKALIGLNKRKKINNSRNTSLTISVAGSEHRVGVTHLGLSFALYLNHNGFCAYYKDLNTPDISDLLKKSNDAGRLTLSNGLFTYKGLNIIPAYNETIDFDETELTACKKRPVIFINDCGMLTEHTSDIFNKADICILVGSGGKPWEITKMYESMKYCNKNKTFFVVNLLSGALFYRLIKRQNDIFIRMPFYYDWNMPGTIGKRFLAELTDEIKKRWRE